MARKKLTKRQKEKAMKFAIKNWSVVVAFVMIVVVLLTIAYFMGWLDFLFKPEPVMPSQAGGFTTEVDTLDDLKITFLDVGQGDTIIIELPDNKNMIIDSGEDNDAMNAIREYTTLNNITTFDYLLLTHQDSDHSGNMNTVIEEYDVRYIFRPRNYSSHTFASSLPSEFNPDTEGYDSTTKTYAQFMVSAHNEGCIVEVFNKDSDFTNNIVYNGNTYSYTFDFLTPTASRETIEYDNPNDYSPIMTLEYLDKKIMFTGDAELDALSEYVTTYSSLKNVDVLKVGHHGSHNATTMDFVEAVDPEYAIIQCGYQNKHEHPHQQVLDIFQNYDGGVTIYRNDTNGDVTLKVSSSGLSFELERDDCSKNFVNGESLVLSAIPSFNRYVENYKTLVA